MGLAAAHRPQIEGTPKALAIIMPGPDRASGASEPSSANFIDGLLKYTPPP